MPFTITSTFSFGANDQLGPSISGFSPTPGPLGTSFTITGARLSGVTNLYLLHPEFADDKIDFCGLTSVEILSNSTTGIDFTTGLVPSPASVPEANRVAISGVIPTDFPRFPQRIGFRIVTSGYSGVPLEFEAITGNFTPFLDDLHVNQNLHLHSGNDYESKIYTHKDGSFGYLRLDTPSTTGIILSSFTL